MKLFITYAAAVSVIAFILCGTDKHRAAAKKCRIPEKVLFFISAIGGSVGMLFGMLIFRHKTKHPSFVIGIPMIIFMQAVIVFAFARFFIG